MSGRRKAVLLILRLGIGGLLCWAGVSKLPAPWMFAEAIANYRLLPAQGNQILAVVLPWWEIGAGILLVLGLWVRPASFLASGLFAVFATAALAALVRGLDIDCGCFGSERGSQVGLRLLLMEAVFLAGSLGVAFGSASDQGVQKVR